MFRYWIWLSTRKYLSGRDKRSLLEHFGTPEAVYLADEFYIMAEKPIPDYDDYEGFPQIENGVGLYSSLKYELEFIDSGFNFYRNNRLVAGGYFVRDNENIRLHWNFGYGMQASLFSCGVVVCGKIRENIGTGIYEFEIDYKKFEPKVADKIKMPWLPDIFNKENILFIKKTN